MTKFASNLRERELKMNVNKTMIMNISRDQEEAIEIVFDGRREQNVDQFENFGRIFKRSGECEKKIVGRIEKYGLTVRALYLIIKDRVADVNVNKIILNSMLKPMLTYDRKYLTLQLRKKRKLASVRW